MTGIRVELPVHLRALGRIDGELRLLVPGAPTIDGVLDSLEAEYPMLRGTIRDQATGRRRAYIRYFACGEDLSHEPSSSDLPDEVSSGAEPLRIIGAIAGG